MKTLKQAYEEVKRLYPDMGISGVAQSTEVFLFDLVQKGKKLFDEPSTPVLISRVEGKEYGDEWFDDYDRPSIYSICGEELEKIFSAEDYALYKGYQSELIIN